MMFSKVISAQPGSAYPSELRKRIDADKGSLTLMSSMHRLTSLATSNASFFFVMGSRGFLWLVVTIW